MHCKSGADRAGLMSVLYLHFVERMPIEEARHQIGRPLRSFPVCRTGILDFVFERYLRDTARAPMPFLDWVETAYDPVALKQEFPLQGLANRWSLGCCGASSRAQLRQGAGAVHKRAHEASYLRLRRHAGRQPAAIFATMQLASVGWTCRLPRACTCWA
jgi:hypothetical protein